MTILAVAAQAELLAPVVLRVRQAPLGLVVPRPGPEVLRAAAGAAGPVELVEQQDLRVHQARRVQPARVSAAVRLMRERTRLTHRTLLSELNMNSGFAADGGPIPAQVSRSANALRLRFRAGRFQPHVRSSQHLEMPRKQ